MTEIEKKNTHSLINILLLVFIIPLESSLWPQFFSPIPRPQLWLGIIVFIFLYRKTFESILSIYISSLFIFSLTSESLGYILLAQTLLFLSVSFIKRRIFIPDQIYFSIIYSSMVFIFHLLLYIFMWIFESGAISYPQVLSWILQTLIAFLVSPIIFGFMGRINPLDESENSGDSIL